MPSYGKPLYEKKGNRYIPVNDPYACDGLTNGAWLVIVEPNSKSMRTLISPKFIELEAALRYLEDGLCNAMRKAGEIRSRSVKISPKEQRAWKAFRKTMGKDMPTTFEYASNWEVANAGCEYVRKVMIENNMDVDVIREKFKPKEKSINPIFDLEIK